MTTATRRVLDPPGSRAQGCDSREGDSREGDSVEAERAPARALLLTMQSVSRTHPELLARLTDSFFDLRTLARWEQFLSEVDRLPGGLVLLDLDEAERSPSLRELRLSAHRLVHLLARQIKDTATALVVVTARDYAEIEDVMRAGVHALLHPGSDVEWCVEQARRAASQRITAHERKRAQREARGDRVAVATAPVPMSSAAAPEPVEAAESAVFARAAAEAVVALHS